MEQLQHLLSQPDPGIWNSRGNAAEFVEQLHPGSAMVFSPALYSALWIWTGVGGVAVNPQLSSCASERSQNHRIPWTGRDPPGSQSPTPSPAQRLQQSHPVPESVVQMLLEFWQSWGCNHSLGSLFQVSVFKMGCIWNCRIWSGAIFPNSCLFRKWGTGERAWTGGGNILLSYRFPKLDLQIAYIIFFKLLKGLRSFSWDKQFIFCWQKLRACGTCVG